MPADRAARAATRAASTPYDRNAAIQARARARDAKKMAHTVEMLRGIGFSMEPPTPPRNSHIAYHAVAEQPSFQEVPLDLEELPPLPFVKIAPDALEDNNFSPVSPLPSPLDGRDSFAEAKCALFDTPPRASAFKVVGVFSKITRSNSLHSMLDNNMEQ